MKPLLTLALMVTFTGHAQSQMACGDRGEIIQVLQQVHKEVRAATALSNGAAVELFLSAGGTWTIMRTFPGGLTCLLGTGTDWDTATAPKQQTQVH